MLRRAWETKRQIIDQLNRRILAEGPTNEPQNKTPEWWRQAGAKGTLCDKNYAGFDQETCNKWKALTPEEQKNWKGPDYVDEMSGRPTIEDRNKRKLENRKKKSMRTSITNISDSDATRWARKLYDSMKGLGTSEGEFKTVTEKFYKCESCIKKIRIAFKQAYGTKGDRDLRSWIEGDFSGEAESKALKAWGYVN